MKLTDTQTAILAAAAQHPEGLILPPPTPPAPRAQIARKFSILGVAEAVDLDADQPPAMAWRTEQDGRRIGLRITGTGRSAIGAAPAAEPEAITMTAEERQEAAEAEAVLRACGQDDGEVGLSTGDDEMIARDAEQTMEAIQRRNMERLAEPMAAMATAAVMAPTPAEQKRGIASRAVRKAVRASAKAAEEAVARGELPTPPDFSAETHKPYRGKREKLIALAEAGDIEGLRAVAINPTSTSPKALIRYRDLAIRALEARAAR